MSKNVEDYLSQVPAAERAVLEQLRKLEPYDIAGQGATIRFTVDSPLPAALVKKIVMVRMQEIKSRKA